MAPPTFNIINSMLFLCAVVLGGQGNKLGVILGAFIIEPKDTTRDPAYDLDYTITLDLDGPGRATGETAPRAVRTKDGPKGAGGSSRRWLNGA